MHSITFTGPVVPQGAVKVLWTRGSKQAETADGFVGGGAGLGGNRFTCQHTGNFFGALGRV